MIPDRLLKKFFENYKKEFGIELSDEELLKKATTLIELYKAVFDVPLENYQSDDNNKIK